MKETMNEQESLRIIQEMIEKSKTNFGEGSYFYLLWGWLVLIASLTHFILLSLSYAYPFIMWPVVMVIGVVLSILKSRGLKKKSKVKTYAESAIIYLWTGFSVSMFIILVASSYGKISWPVANSFIIMLYGIGTYVSGGIFKFSPLKIGGIASWIIALVSIFTPAKYIMLAVALSIVVSYLWPGYLLRSKEKLQNHVQGA